MANGRANFTRGNVFAMNFQGGTVSITTDASGDGTTSVTFKKAMNTAPNAVVALPRQALTTGVVYAKDITSLGCTLGVDGSSATGSAVQFSYIAYDDSYN